MEILSPLTLLFLVVVAAALWMVFRLAPRPTLDPTPPTSSVPEGLQGAELAHWLTQTEGAISGVIEDTQACIEWANEPGQTDLCVLYIHGFSATRQETAPLSEKLARHFNANLVHARLAGHGLNQGEGAMEASAEQWLASMVDIWDVASRVGRRVVIVACSTGAPLSIWLKHTVAPREKLHSLVFLAPNIQIRSPMSFLLTWPWARQWVPLVIGREHQWEPENELTRRYWTWRYSSMAVIEMQKMVDWLARTKIETGNLPLATLFMEGDPTINDAAAVAFHEAWDADIKSLHRVEIDAHNPQHVFVGAITAPQRVDWCVDVCTRFIEAANTSYD